MSGSLYEVAVPNETLAAPKFEPMPAGPYRSTLQPGTEITSNGNGWRALKLPFKGFEGAGGSFAQRERAALFTIESSSEDAVRIGREGVIGAAQAFGLTRETTKDGKPSQALTASSDEELVAQFNSMAGTEVEVYVTVKERKKGGVVQRKENGDPILDNEIRRISAIKRA